MHLRVEAGLQGEAVFRGFDPSQPDDAIHFVLHHQKHPYAIRLQLGRGVGRNRGITPETPPGYAWYKDLVIRIEWIPPDPALESDLRQQWLTGPVQDLYGTVADLLTLVIERFLQYVKHIHRQELIHWDAAPGHERAVVYRHLLDGWYPAVWESAPGIWDPLIVEGAAAALLPPPSDEPWPRPVPVDYSTAITAARWQELQRFLGRNKPAPLWWSLLYNSRQHLDDWHLDSRMALVEAVTALEAAIKSLLPAVVRHLPGHPNPDAKSVDRLLQEVGLRSVTAVIFELIGDTIGLSAQDRRRCLEAVETRNNIIHNGKRSVEATVARTYVDAIDQAIRQLVLWAEERVPPGEGTAGPAAEGGPNAPAPDSPPDTVR